MKNHKWMFDRINEGEYVTYNGEDWRDKKEKFYRDACKVLGIPPQLDSSRAVFDIAYDKSACGWLAVYIAMDELYDRVLGIHRMMVNEGV